MFLDLLISFNDTDGNKVLYQGGNSFKVYKRNGLEFIQSRLSDEDILKKTETIRQALRELLSDSQEVSSDE